MPETAEKPSTEIDHESKGPQRDAVEKAAHVEHPQEDLTPEDRMDATAWFLAEEPEDAAATHTFKLRVGMPGDEFEWVQWTIQSLERENIASIRETARKQTRNQQPGSRRRRGPEDEELVTAEMLANLRIAAEGTIQPDLHDAKVRGKYADPADALKARFKTRSGLIDQIAAEVIRLSGYDDEDVQEVEAVKS